MYFEKFPTITYSNQYITNPILVIDITRRAKIRDAIANQLWLFEPYIIRDGDRPDTIAAKYYNNPGLHWLVMIANDRLNLYDDWPLTEQQLYEVLIRRYGSDSAIHAPHHYVDQRGVIVHETDTVLKKPVSIFEYETAINDQKRVIKLIHPDLVDSIVEQFNREIAL